MKKIATILLILLTGFCHGQAKDFFKIWIGTADYRIGDNNLGILEIEEEEVYEIISDNIIKFDSVATNELRFKDSIKKANQPIKEVTINIDTSYYSIEVLLDIKKNGEAVFKRIGIDEKIISWTKIGQKEIKLNFEKPLIARLDSLNHLTLVFYEEPSSQHKFLFEPISESHLKIPINEIETILSNHLWDVPSVEDKSKGNSRRFLFEDDSLFIATYKDDTTTFISRNKWKLDEYKQHKFIFVGFGYLPFYMHLIELKNSPKITFKVDRFRLNNFPEESVPPKFDAFEIIGHNLLTEKEYKDINARLIGFWTTENEPFPVPGYKNIFDYTQTNTFFTYDFGDDGFVIINFGGEITDEYGIRTINESVKQKWRLSRSGDVLIFEDGQNSNLMGAINFLDKNTIELRKNIRSLSGNYVENMAFKLRKKVE